MNGFISAWECSASFQEFAIILGIYLAMATSLVAAVVLVVNLLARRWLTSRQMGFLWGLVLLRLAMPLVPESVVSFQTLFKPSEVEVQETIVLRDAYATAGSSNLESHQWPEGKIISKPVEATVPEVGMLESLSHSLFSVLEASLIGIVEFRYSALIWLVVSMLILFRMLITHWRFTRQVKQTPVSKDERLLSLWNSCCEQVGIRRPIPVILFDHVAQPSIMGAIRPRLLLPSDVAELNDEQLKLIMLHELAHVRRRDVAINWGLFSLRLLHWWNPIYWLATSRYCNLREQTCDAMVLRWMSSPSDEKGKRDYCSQYSELLLTLAQRPDVAPRWQVRLPVSILGLFSSSFRKRKISNRLHALRRSTFKRHPVNTFIAMALILLIAVCGLTNAKEPAEQNKLQVQQSASGENEPKYFYTHEKIDNSEKIVVQVYSIADLIVPMSEEDRAKAEAAGIYIPPAIPLDTLLQDIEQVFISMLPPDRLEEKLLKKYKIDVHSEITSKEKVNRAAIRFNQPTLSIVIRTPQSVHEEIGKRLNAYRESGRYQITTAPIFFSAQTNIAESLGIKWSERKTDELPPSVVRGKEIEKIGEPAPAELPESVKAFPIRTALLTKKQWHRFILSAQKDKDADILFAPQATLLNGQKALLVDKGQHPLIPVLSSTGAVELKPRYVGTEITLRTSINEDQSILLHVKYVRGRIKAVDTFPITIKGKKTSLQVPQINTRAIQPAVKLEDSQALLIEHEHVKGNNMRHYLLLTVNKANE